IDIYLGTDHLNTKPGVGIFILYETISIKENFKQIVVDFDLIMKYFDKEKYKKGAYKIMVKIYLDAGHGGQDGGASANGLVEKKLTLKIAKKMNSLLKDYKNVTVKMSRKTDKTVSLKSRTDEANKWGADLFLSVHINAGGGTGFESYVYNGAIELKTEKVRTTIHNEIMKLINVTDRGKKKKNLHVTRESRMPALLTENLFIDTKKDDDKLKKQSFNNKIAQGHVNGIVKLYHLEKKKGSTIPKGKLYKVQTGAFSKKSNDVKLVNNLKKDGFDGFIVQTKYYKVQTGAFSKKSNANSMVKKLKKKGYDTVIIRE